MNNQLSIPQKLKYGSLEYHVEEAKKELDKVKEALASSREEVGQIREVGKIDVSFRYIRDYFNRNSYREFDENNEIHILEAVTNATQALELEKKRVEFLHDKNSEALKNNEDLVEKVSKYMNFVGIPSSYSVYEVPKGCRNKKHIIKTAGFLLDLGRVVPTSDGYKGALNKIDSFENEIAKFEKSYLEKIRKFKLEKDKKDAELRKLAAAMVIAEELGLKYETNEELLDSVNSLKEKEWREENFAENTVVSGGCQDCDSWKVGERRCVCKNRRVYLDVSGNFFDGFSGYVAVD